MDNKKLLEFIQLYILASDDVKALVEKVLRDSLPQSELQE